MGIINKFTKKYLPKKGDIVFIKNKKDSHSIYTSAIVVSNNVFNNNTTMVIVCPITNNVKYHPTRYLLKETKKIDGSVMCEHIRSIDYKVNNLIFVEKATKNEIEKIIDLVNACINE